MINKKWFALHRELAEANQRVVGFKRETTLREKQEQALEIINVLKENYTMLKELRMRNELSRCYDFSDLNHILVDKINHFKGTLRNIITERYTEEMNEELTQWTCE